MSISSNAARAAESVVSEAEAPASNACCAAGEQAFGISVSTLAAEYTQMLAALNVAAAELSFQAEANISVWGVTEQQIQLHASMPNTALANFAANLVLAEAGVTENAFATAESTLAAEIVNAELAIQLAETVLSAEQTMFLAEAGCSTAETTAESGAEPTAESGAEPTAQLTAQTMAESTAKA